MQAPHSLALLRALTEIFLSKFLLICVSIFHINFVKLCCLIAWSHRTYPFRTGKFILSINIFLQCMAYIGTFVQVSFYQHDFLLLHVITIKYRQDRLSCLRVHTYLYLQIYTLLYCFRYTVLYLTYSILQYRIDYVCTEYLFLFLN